jgi:hypothetical protein
MHSHTCTQRGKATCKHSDLIGRENTHLYICMKKSRGERRRENNNKEIVIYVRMISHLKKGWDHIEGEMKEWEREKDVKAMPVTDWIFSFLSAASSANVCVDLRWVRFGSELPAWPAAWQALGGLPHKATWPGWILKFWPGLNRPSNIRPGYQARSDENWWPGCDMIFISVIIILKHEMTSQVDEFVYF